MEQIRKWSWTVSNPEASCIEPCTEFAGFIRERGLLIGDNLPGEAELADRMGVSRTVIREAVRGLSVLGIIDIGNGRKPRVAAATAFPFVMSLAHATQTGQITVEQIWESALAASRSRRQRLRQRCELKPRRPSSSSSRIRWVSVRTMASA